MENKIKLTPEQQDVLIDLSEFYNTHDVTDMSFGYRRKSGKWQGAWVMFYLKNDRQVSFRFKRELITDDFEQYFLYLIHKNSNESLFPDPQKLNTDREETWKAFNVGGNYEK